MPGILTLYDFHECALQQFGGIMVSTLVYNVRDLGLIPTVAEIIPIFITIMTLTLFSTRMVTATIT